MAIDDEIDEVLQDDTPQGRAVKTLTEVKNRKEGEPSSVELKTELTDESTCLHTSVDIMADVLSMSEKEFNTKNILSALTEKKERKLLSLNRASRNEIVAVARNPDVQVTAEEMKGGFVKNLFRRHQK